MPDSPEYDFQTQLLIGAGGEKKVIEAMRRNKMLVQIEDDLRLQRLGIDCWIKRRREGVVCYYSVEIKTDTKADETGNAFLEYAIVDNRGTKPGYLPKCTAQMIAYYVVGLGKIFFYETMRLKEFMLENMLAYPTRVSSNGHYRGRGLCVPLVALEDCLFESIDIWQT